jgi:hypothetical protein
MLNHSLLADRRAGIHGSAGNGAACDLLMIKPPRKTDVWAVAGMMVAALAMIALLAALFMWGKARDRRGW